MNDKPGPRRAWAIVALLFLFMAINFADKAVIGLAAVPIMNELRLGPRQFGLIGSGFFLLFSVSAVVTGFIVNRVAARWALLAMGLVWALAQFPMLGAAGFSTLLGCRILLGAGEGPAYPVALHATYKWFPNELRTLPTAIVAQGSAVGILVALPALNWIIVRYSWHWAFGALGMAALVWCAAWLLLGREGPIAGPAGVSAAPAPGRLPYRRLLANPTIVASWCATFGAYWGLATVLTWQAAFLIKGLGLTQKEIGLLSALPPAASVAVVIAGGWLSQRLFTGGWSSRASRGLYGGACVVLGGLALAIMGLLPGAALKIAATTSGIALSAIIYVVGPAVVGEITPLAQRAALLAIGTAVGSAAGLLAPYVMGSVVARAASPLAGFTAGYAICGAIMVAGGLIGMALIHPERDAARLVEDVPPRRWRRA